MEIKKLIPTLDRDPNATKIVVGSKGSFRKMINPHLKKYLPLFESGDVSVHDWCNLFQTIVYGQRPSPTWLVS